MHRQIFAAVAVASVLGWGLTAAHGQQSTGQSAGASGQSSPSISGQSSPSDSGQSSTAASGQSSPTQSGQSAAMPSGGTGGTTRPSGDIKSDPSKMQTYVQMRKYLQSQVISMTPADLSGSRDAIDKHLKAASPRNWLSTDEFIQIHRQVNEDPQLKQMVETQMAGGGASASGGAAAGGATTSGGGASSTTSGASSGGAATSGAQPSSSPK